MSSIVPCHLCPSVNYSLIFIQFILFSWKKQTALILSSEHSWLSLLILELCFSFSGEARGQLVNKWLGKITWNHHISKKQACDCLWPLLCTIPASHNRMSLLGQAASMLTKYLSPMPWTGEREVFHSVVLIWDAKLLTFISCGSWLVPCC